MGELEPAGSTKLTHKRRRRSPAFADEWLEGDGAAGPVAALRRRWGANLPAESLGRLRGAFGSPLTGGCSLRLDPHFGRPSRGLRVADFVSGPVVHADHTMAECANERSKSPRSAIWIAVGIVLQPRPVIFQAADPDQIVVAMLIASSIDAKCHGGVGISGLCRFGSGVENQYLSQA